MQKWPLNLQKSPLVLHLFPESCIVLSEIATPIFFKRKENVMKKNNNQVLSTRMLFVVTISLLVLLCGIQIWGRGKKWFDSLALGRTGAKVETWAEQTWTDKWFGDGFWQTRTLYTVNPRTANKSIVYKNRKLLLSAKNRTKKTQTANYSYTETRGHTVSSEIKAKEHHFEVAVGYSFKYATSKSYRANVKIPAGKSVKLYGSDVQIKEQYTTYRKQPQVATNLTATKWKNRGASSSSNPLIKEYSGYHFEWI